MSIIIIPQRFLGHHQIMKLKNASNLSYDRIFLWSIPRTRSIAFTRAMYQLPSVEVLLEPFVPAAYLTLSGKSNRLRFLFELGTDATFPTEVPFYYEAIKQVETATEKAASNNKKLFVKEHAFCVWPNIISDEMFKTSINTFIIRDCEKTIKSQYQTCEIGGINDLDQFVANETGFRQMWQMYDYVTNVLQLDALIMDSDDLIEQPKEYLKKYCEFVGVDYNDCMLDWSDDYNNNNSARGEIKTLPWHLLEKCGYKYVSTMINSNGFEKKDKMKNYSLADRSTDVYYAIKHDMRYYRKLWQNRIQL